MLAIDLNLSRPFIARGSHDAFEAGRITGRARAVSQIHTMRNSPKIAFAIVQGVAIDMINNIPGLWNAQNRMMQIDIIP